MLTLLVWNHFLILTATCSSFLGAPHLGSRDGARTGQGHRLEPREGGTAKGRMPMQMGTSAGSLTSSEATEFLCRVPVISIQRGGLIDYRVPEALSGIPVWAPPPASSHSCLGHFGRRKGPALRPALQHIQNHAGLSVAAPGSWGWEPTFSFSTHPCLLLIWPAVLRCAQTLSPNWLKPAELILAQFHRQTQLRAGPCLENWGGLGPVQVLPLTH